MERTRKMPEANLEEFIKSLGALAVLEGKVTKRPVDQDFVRKLKEWSTGLFRIVVMGEIKKGKSSFINALIGVRDLVPVSTNIATSTIYKICYGEKIEYKVFFTPESKKPCISIDKSELPKYGTEDGNPANKEQVDFIQVFVPSDFLKGGLVIIDTPGLGGLFKQHKRITYEYVPKADAVFMVSDSVESPIGKAELELLDDLRKVTDQIFFIQTKSMAVDTDARRARERNNRQTLERHGFCSEELRYFVVDSQLKLEADEAKDKEDLVDSGFIPLAMFVNNEIKANVRRHIMRTAIKVAMPKFMEIERALNNEQNMLSADNEESRKKIADELTAAEEEAANWQRHELPRMQDSLQDGIRKIKTMVADRTHRLRPGGELQEAIAQEISACEDIESLFARLEEFSQNAGNCYTKERYQILEAVRAELTKLLETIGGFGNEISTQRVNATTAEETITVITDPIIRVEESNSKGSFFDTARTVMYGGMAGGTMASVVGGLIGSVLPGLGTIIGSMAGVTIAGFLGGREALKIKQFNELEKAKQQAIGSIAQVISSAYQNLTESIQRELADIERSVTRTMRDAVSHRQEDILNRRKELQSRQSETAAQLAVKRKELETNQRVLSSIKELVGRVM